MEVKLSNIGEQLIVEEEVSAPQQQIEEELSAPQSAARLGPVTQALSSESTKEFLQKHNILDKIKEDRLRYELLF